MTIRLELSELEAELLHQALTLIVQASSPELMRQCGWEGADHITATALIQNAFDPEDIALLSAMAEVVTPLNSIVDPLYYSQHNINDHEMSVESSHGEPFDIHHSACSPAEPKPDLGENVVSLNDFRNRS